MKLIISLRKPLSRFVIAFCTSLLFQSCEKAPAEGEAFITLKSNEVLPLADTEIMFFGSNFAEEFETFRVNLVAEKKDELKSKLNNKLSGRKKELENLEELRASIAETTRKSQKENIQNLRTGLNKKMALLDDMLKESNPLVQKLEEKFSTYSQTEAALVQKANKIEAEAHRLSVALILKVNKAIVSERIAISKYKENHRKPKLREFRSVSEMIQDKTLPYDFGSLSDVSEIVCKTTESHDITKDYHTGFPIRKTRNGKFQVAESFSKKLHDIKDAIEIRKDWLVIKNYEPQLKALFDQARKNHKDLNQVLQVYANSDGTTADSITEQLSKRANTEEEISKIREELDEWKDGSEKSDKALDLAIQTAKKNLEQAIENQLEEVEELATVLSTLSSSSRHEILGADGMTEAIIQQAILKFFASNKLSSTRTGRDGKFAIPPKARYVSLFLIREIQEEQLFWLIKIDLEETSVTLTNSNVTKTGMDRALLGALDCNLLE